MNETQLDKQANHRLALIYSNADLELMKAQVRLEDNILAYAQACDVLTTAQIVYDKSFADAIEKLSIGGEKVTIIKEKAKLQCTTEYKVLCDAENLKDRFKKFIEVGQEKLNTIKKIMDHTGRMTK